MKKLLIWSLGATLLVGTGVGIYFIVDTTTNNHQNDGVDPKGDDGTATLPLIETTTAIQTFTIDSFNEAIAHSNLKTNTDYYITDNQDTFHTINGSDVVNVQKDYEKVITNSGGTANINEIKNSWDEINHQAYYYYDGHPIMSDDENERKLFFSSMIYERNALFPSNIQIISVSKPNGLRHNVDVTFSDGNSSETMSFDFNHEDDKREAFNMNHNSWLMGRLKNGVDNVVGTLEYFQTFKSSHPTFDNVWTFLSVRRISQVLHGGVNIFFGGNVLLPILPLYLASYGIYETGQFAINTITSVL